MKIHLLGDSLVQTRMAHHGKFYCGWGDPLRFFFDEAVEIRNYAMGGRSCRSFLNEGRFVDDGRFTKEMPPYHMGPALSEIGEGDYVLIQFMCNDDDSASCAYRVNKHVWLGEADANGVYPTVVPTEEMRRPTTGWDEGYEEALRAEGYSPERIETIIETTAGLIEMAGDPYHPFDSGATYKGYHKFYIDKIREKGAYPILVVTGATHSFTDGKLLPRPGLCGGKDAHHEFPYAVALRQLGKEENVPVIDVFSVDKPLYDALGEEKAAYLHNLSVVENDVANIDSAADQFGPPRDISDWLSDFNARMETKNYTAFDPTHRNHFGAFLEAAEIADSMYAQGILKEHILKKPSAFPGLPKGLEGEKARLAAFLTYITAF